MDGSLEEARYARLRWNTPLGVEHADLLLERLDLTADLTVADLGCGWGALLLRAVARSGATGIGIDTDPAGLDRGRRDAEQSGLSGRVSFMAHDAAAWRGRADRALCIGAAHAFGGLRPMLAALAEVVPQGRVLIGDGFWTAPPTPAARDLFGEALVSLQELAAACRTAGWQTIHLSTADQREWDDFEFRHRAGRQEWLLANPEHPRAAEIRAWLDEREREYLEVYRGLLGFAYLVLAR